MPKRIFAGEFERRGASETVKLTVVGDGRRTWRRPGISKGSVNISREVSPLSEDEAQAQSRLAQSSLLVE